MESGCGGRERLLKFKVCGLAGVPAEGMRSLPASRSTKFVDTCNQADRECNRKAVPRKRKRKTAEEKAERRMTG